MLASTEPDQPMQLVSQDDGKGQKKLHGEPGLEPEGGGTLDTQEGPALLMPRTSGIWGFLSFRAKAWNVERAHLPPHRSLECWDCRPAPVQPSSLCSFTSV